MSLQDSAGVETVFKVKKSTKFKRILEVRLRVRAERKRLGTGKRL
jgi:hypothetical protein